LEKLHRQQNVLDSRSSYRLYRVLVCVAIRLHKFLFSFQFLLRLWCVPGIRSLPKAVLSPFFVERREIPLLLCSGRRKAVR